MYRKQMLERMQENYKRADGAFKRIYDHLQNTEVWKHAQMIGMTMAKEPEIPTRFLLEMAWLQNKQVCIPRCNATERSMVFYQIERSSMLELSCYGLLEPNIKCPVVSPDQIDLMIVPGVVFNRQGHRIGFGGGYYDRYLSFYPNKKVALVLSEQLCEDFVAEKHDIAVQMMITETAVIEVETRTNR